MGAWVSMEGEGKGEGIAFGKGEIEERVRIEDRGNMHGSVFEL
jgi:hypothetical protein